MCLESGRREPLQVGGWWHDGPSAHYQEIKSKCKRCTIFLGSGGLDNQEIGGDNKSVLKELKITRLEKWKVTGKQLGQCCSKG